MNHYSTRPRGSLEKSWEWNETSRYRNFFFTKNNYTDADYQFFLTRCDEGQKPKATYVAVSKEVGAQGTPHLHAIVYFKDAQFPRVIRNKFRNCWLEPCFNKSTLTQQLEYLSKENPVEERGTRPNENPNHGRHAGGDATKAAWEVTKQLAREGRLEEIEACHYITQYNNLKRIARDAREKPRPLPDGSRKVAFEWWYGDAGAGKSKAAWKKLTDEFGEDFVFDKPPTTKWVDDSYPPTSAWRINDVDKYQSKHLGCEFKIWAEESPFRSEDKNTSTWVRPAKIIVTSNPPPWQIWDDPHTIDAILDRYKIVYWPRKYTPNMPKPDMRVDAIHPPWDYVAPVLRQPQPIAPPTPVRDNIEDLFEEPIPPPVLRRTGSISLTNTIWNPPEVNPISAEENRENIRRWLGEFNDLLL